mmetsp:Transcript_10675/g.11737  ORF Transcript_10675/g.11737 Transcript_10675/m.11737 type:complete len:561 (+) Transcript_10675:58-1740(+)
MGNSSVQKLMREHREAPNLTASKQYRSIQAIIGVYDPYNTGFLNDKKAKKLIKDVIKVSNMKSEVIKCFGGSKHTSMDEAVDIVYTQITEDGKGGIETSAIMDNKLICSLLESIGEDLPDVISTSKSDMGRAEIMSDDSGDSNSEETSPRLSHSSVLFLFKVVNGILNNGDIRQLEMKEFRNYLPLLLQIASVRSAVIERLNRSPRLKTHMLWLARAGCHMCEEYKTIPQTSRVKRTAKFYNDLIINRKNEGDRYTDLRILDPVFNKCAIVTDVYVKKVFVSRSAPVLLMVHYKKKKLLPKKMMFKRDDMRSDVSVELVFSIFNTLWQSASLGDVLKVYTAKVVPCGPKFGFMEYIENSVSVREYNWNAFDWFTDAHMEAFMASAAGGYVSGYVLGLRDRHKDNLMIKDNHTFFHIDFEHVFNLTTFPIDAPSLAIPKKMKANLIVKGKWKEFKRRCAQGYLTLRRNNGWITYLCNTIFRGLFSQELIDTTLHAAFFLDKSEDDACNMFLTVLEHGVVSLRKKLKNTTHSLIVGSKDLTMKRRKRGKSTPEPLQTHNSYK